MIVPAFGATAEEVKQNIITQAKEMGVEPAIVLSIAKTELFDRDSLYISAIPCDCKEYGIRSL